MLADTNIPPSVASLSIHMDFVMADLSRISSAKIEDASFVGTA